MSSVPFTSQFFSALWGLDLNSILHSVTEQFKSVMSPYYNWPFTILITEKFALKLISSMGREGLFS